MEALVASAYQQRFWSTLVEARVHCAYLNQYAAASEWRDKAVNIFLAVTSSSSIAAWAIWRDYTWVWPILIAGAQVASAVKPFLPYNQRQKAVTSLCGTYQSICLQIESKWFSVAEGIISDQEIHEETIRLRGLLLESERKSLDGMVLPKSETLMNRAEAETRQYFVNHYPVEEAI